MLFQLHRRRSSPFLRQNPRHMHFSDRFNQRLRGPAGGMLATLTFLALNWGAVHDCLREKLVFRFWQSYTLCTLFFFLLLLSLFRWEIKRYGAAVYPSAESFETNEGKWECRFVPYVRKSEERFSRRISRSYSPRRRNLRVQQRPCARTNLVLVLFF